MSSLAADREIVDLEWRRVTSIAWPVLSLISIVSALLSDTPFETWQILYAIGLFMTLIASYLLRKYQVIKFSDTPTVLYLLFSPILMGDRPDTSWTSLGLTVFASVIYYSTLKNMYLAISVVITLSILQSIVASMDYASFTDSTDLSLLYSYFSTVWTLGIGISSVFIRKRYFEKAERIEEKIDAEINNSLSEISKLKQVNQKDSFNLKLHGTVLNTLIYMRNALHTGIDFKLAYRNLENEIVSLDGELAHQEPKQAQTSLSSLISNRTLKRVRVTLDGSEEISEDLTVTETIGEIVREYLLNLEKHTDATHLDISITESQSESRIIFQDDAMSQKLLSRSKQLLENPKKSFTLMAILKDSAASIEISKSFWASQRRTVIKVPKLKLEESLSSSIAKARLLGLNEFVLNFFRAGFLVLILSIPGYAIVGVDKFVLLLLLIFALYFFLILTGRRSPVNLLTAIISSSLLIPTSSYISNACVELAVLPWIWNHILILGFFVAIEIRNNVLKWIPITVLAVQSIAYPFTYPDQCQAIFQGSVPGIPLFILLALSVMQIRKRELKLEKFQAAEILRLAQVSSESDLHRKRELSALISETRGFMNSLEEQNQNQSKEGLLNLEIEKIQSYLVCSEYFDSPIIRKIYKIFSNELNSGVPGKVQIMGNLSSLKENQIDSNLLLSLVSQEKSGRPLSLTIISVDQLELIFEGYGNGEVTEEEIDYGAFKIIRLAIDRPQTST